MKPANESRWVIPSKKIFYRPYGFNYDGTMLFHLRNYPRVLIHEDRTHLDNNKKV